MRIEDRLEKIDHMLSYAHGRRWLEESEHIKAQKEKHLAEVANEEPKREHKFTERIRVFEPISDRDRAFSPVPPQKGVYMMEREVFCSCSRFSARDYYNLNDPDEWKKNQNILR